MLRLLKYKTKKGAIELQFNWIFVLIVGGIILFFVYSLISAQKSSAELSINQEILRSIDAVVTSATTNLGTTNQIRLQPKQEINFECNKIAVKSGPPKVYSNLIMFAPNKIKGSRLITQTVDFSIPFRVANFVYASSDDVRYILIADSLNPSRKLAEEVNRTISDKFNKEFRKKIEGYTDDDKPDSKFIITALRDEKNYKVRVVFFDTTQFNNNKNTIAGIFSKKHDITILKILPNAANKDIGSVEYYNYDGTDWVKYSTISYFKISSLTGAIFFDIGKETEGQYTNCIMENLKSRVNLVLEVYSQRAGELGKDASLGRCSTDYSSAIVSMTGNTNSIQSKINSNNLEITAEIKNIENANQQLQQKSCPLIY